MANVAIIGAGVMGTAIAYPLADNGHAVRLVGTHLDREIIRSCLEQRYHPRLKRQLPAGVQPHYVDDIARALEGAEIIVSGVNSAGVRWIGRTLGPHLRAGQLIIAVTKGLETADSGDLIILPDVLAGALPHGIRRQVKVAAIGGPCIAAELARRRQSCVVFGSRDGEAVQRLATAFRTSYYHVWTTTDLLGLEVCAALKNAYALCVGLAHGVLERVGGSDAAGAHMHNLAAAIFAQACAEMDRVLQLVGATLAFAYQLAGAGDLYVTCQGGRNMRLGRLLGLGHNFADAQTVRTMGDALPRLEARGVVAADELPLMRALIDIVVDGHPVDLRLDAFFNGVRPRLGGSSECAYLGRTTA